MAGACGTLASMPVTASDLPNLTNLDKVFWPEEGYTKLDLLTYYQRVAPVLLPYVVDRPQALCRRPDGWNVAGCGRRAVG
jgi:bifunctional non-homologous end joining protein LigD